jgi:hypothetical protein
MGAEDRIMGVNQVEGESLAVGYVLNELKWVSLCWPVITAVLSSSFTRL